MRRTLTIFLLKLLLASAALFTLWIWHGEVLYARTYGTLLRALAVDTGAMRDAIPIVTPRFYNIIPFLSLMFAMWGITTRRRLFGSTIGLAIIIAWHVVFLMLVNSIIATDQFTPAAYKRLAPWFLLSDVLPWLLWALICNRPLSSLITRRGGQRNG